MNIKNKFFFLHKEMQRRIRPRTVRGYRRPLNPRSVVSMAGVAAPYIASSMSALYNKFRSKPASKKALVRIRPRLNRRKIKGMRRGTRLLQRVAKLERSQNDSLSKLVYKYDDKDTLRPTVGQATYGYKDAVGTTAIELALAQLRFFDPSAPGTLITASLATPTFSQKIYVSAYASCIIKNNYQVPCVVTYGVAFPKEDTSITPNAARSNGLTDVGNPDPASTLISYKDSPQFRDLWACKLISKQLKAGETLIMKHGQKPFTYDPALQDSHSQTYQKTTKSAVFLYRCQGILGHDTAVTTEQGMMPAGIDVYISTTYYISYNSGGAAVKTIVLNESASQSFTNGGVISQLVVDNQSYSIS